MFDAKSLIDMLARGAGAGQQPQPSGGGGLGDLLGQLGGMLGQQPGGQGRDPGRDPGRGAPGGDGMGGLGDLLRQIAPGGQGEAPRGQPQSQAPGGDGGLGDLLRNMVQPGGQGGTPGGSGAPGGGAGAGGLSDILGKIQEQLGRGGPGGGQGAPGGGGLMDILGQVLGQATQGVKEGAQRVDDVTGASGHAREALQRTTGKNPDELWGQLKDLIEQNKIGAGVAAGGLGTILLGTKTGRAITGNAVKLGGLALIAGLAYKAMQNYQQGKPLIGGPGTGAGGPMQLTEAPSGSGFELPAITNEAATIYLRGMIAAAAADGRIDAAEQQKLIGGLKQAGLDAEAEEFLARELNNPATVEDLVAGVTNEQEAIQLFTAARVAIDLDTQEEHDFLVALAQALGMDAQLVAHIDAAARAA